jgi:microcin C transport system substrate-binding protein
MRGSTRFAVAAAAVLAAAPSFAGEDAESLIAKYRKDLAIPMVRYEWDPKAGDPAVPAEMGGPGFTGEGWTTRLEFPARGMPGAPKGGSMRIYLTDWPATLRQEGENWNESFNYNVNDLCLDHLVIPHPSTLDYIPALATHWWISPDRQTYRFRINPEARWSDGTEVTAEDVVATWKLRMDPKCRYPSSIQTYGKLDQPVAKSKYIVEVHCKDDNWRNFLYIGGMGILPAKEISIPGDQYLDRFQNAFTAMSGPYTVRPEDVRMGQSLALTRRKNWWGAKNPAFSGLYNLDTIVYEVVKDPSLAYEKAKKGDLDLYIVPKAQWWAEEIPKLDPVKRGLLRMLKIYNDAPIGTSGLALNMRKAPLDDLRIRKALQFLYNRPLMIRKLYFNEYEPLTFYEGGIWANPDNKEFPYDPVAAVELLEQAGWTEFDRELYRVKDGRVLKFEIIYRTPLSERSLTIFQEDCKKAGIKIELKLLTAATLWKTLTQKEYEICDMIWGALVFPNPETSFGGKLADQVSNNNVTSFKDPRVDALCREYDLAPDVASRVAIIRKIDGLVYEQVPYVLGWYLPSIRILLWNRYGMPPWGCERTLDNSDPFWEVFWVDPAKEKALEEARRSGGTLPPEEQRILFWRAWNADNLKRERAGGK